MSQTTGLHHCAVPVTVCELCRQLGLNVFSGNSDTKIKTVASLNAARPGALVLVNDRAVIPVLSSHRGVVCLTCTELAASLKSQLTEPVIIIADNPRQAFARLLRHLFPAPKQPPFIHPTAQVDATAVIDPSAAVYAHCVIGPDCRIGPGCVIGAGSVLECDVRLGRDCRIGTHNFLAHLQAADQLVTAAHCVLGKRGYGFEGQGPGLEIMPHLGRVIIGSCCDIAAGVTVDRGVLDATVIGDFVMIDNQVHIAHNVIIGDNTLILGQVGIAGSTVIGKNCILGGQVGVADHLRIADNITVASKSGVTKNLEQAGTYAGFPAVPVREHWRQLAAVRRLNKSQ